MKQEFHFNGVDRKCLMRDVLTIKLRNINYKSFGFNFLRKVMTVDSSNRTIKS